MTQELLYDKRGEIGWVTFNRPHARNALTFAMYEGKAMLARLLANARFELPGGEAPVPVARITLHSRPGISLNVTAT